MDLTGGFDAIHAWHSQVHQKVGRILSVAKVN